MFATRLNAVPVAELKVNTNREPPAQPCNTVASERADSQTGKSMKKNPLNKGIIMENAAGIGTVKPAMVEDRARELAAINGRRSSNASEADYEQAKLTLTGEEEMDPQEESRVSIPESDGWDPVPGL